MTRIQLETNISHNMYPQGLIHEHTESWAQNTRFLLVGAGWRIFQNKRSANSLDGISRKAGRSQFRGLR
jgi:hypothetical protein